jgi:hypothetical protein
MKDRMTVWMAAAKDLNQLLQFVVDFLRVLHHQQQGCTHQQICRL